MGEPCFWTTLQGFTGDTLLIVVKLTDEEWGIHLLEILEWKQACFWLFTYWDNNLPVLRLKHDFNHSNVEQGPILPVYKTNHIKGVSELTQIPVEKTRLLVYWFENEYVSFIYAACVIITVKEINKEKMYTNVHDNYDSILPHLVVLEYT